jgi:hypothetical protein
MNISSPLKTKLLIPSLLLVLSTSLLCAQFSKPKKEKPSKLVLGQVVDGGDQPIPTAIVNLTNLQTKKVSQDITDEKGEFRFAGLNPDADYEVQAVFHDRSGPNERISMYDSRAKREFYWKLPLKLAEANKEVETQFAVVDEQNRGIPGAMVKITANKKIETLIASTDAAGRAHQWLSTADTYAIVVEAKGYETLVREAFVPERSVPGVQFNMKAAK